MTGVACREGRETLDRQGFFIVDIKRISRQEFDVVVTRGGVIFNLQCKNNLVDLNRLEPDVARFSRYNRWLDRYYARAIEKKSVESRY